MLIRTGLKPHVPTLLTLEARHRIGRARLVSVTDVRWAVGIADRRGDVERFGHGLASHLAARDLCIKERPPRQGSRRSGTRLPRDRATSAVQSPPARASWRKPPARAPAVP